MLQDSSWYHSLACILFIFEFKGKKKMILSVKVTNKQTLLHQYPVKVTTLIHYINTIWYST